MDNTKAEIRFNVPPVTGKELEYIQQAMNTGRLAGDNFFTKKCQDWFNASLNTDHSLLTPSCTHALEIAALLLNLAPGDEVIMPSYTFVSTANAFALRGANIVFVDIRPDTMNIDENLIEAAITPRTKAIVPVHYAGVVCEMDKINQLAQQYGLAVIEDAAQAITSTYKGKVAGSLGDLSAFSFHETKNLTAGGEGGLLGINNPAFNDRAEILREKGTNRAQFFKGQTDKYTWVDLGSSYLPSEIQAAYLLAQLESIDQIQQSRLQLWHRYHQALQPYERSGRVTLQFTPEHCEHNAHMFYIKFADTQDRDNILKQLNAQNIKAVFHYIPLHSSKFGRTHTTFHGEDKYTTAESQKLLRLPLWFGMDLSLQDRVIDSLIQLL